MDSQDRWWWLCGPMLRWCRWMNLPYLELQEEWEWLHSRQALSKRKENITIEHCVTLLVHRIFTSHNVANFVRCKKMLITIQHGFWYVCKTFFGWMCLHGAKFPIWHHTIVSACITIQDFFPNVVLDLLRNKNDTCTIIVCGNNFRLTICRMHWRSHQANHCGHCLPPDPPLLHLQTSSLSTPSAADILPSPVPFWFSYHFKPTYTAG